MIVREERPEDAPGVRRVPERAFGQADEANLVDRIPQAGAATVSLVAVSRPADGGARPDDIIGHILFSPVTIYSFSPDVVCQRTQRASGGR